MPKGQYPRFKKVSVQPLAPVPVAAHETPEEVNEAAEITPSMWENLPSGWAKGALLNVRNNGAEYRITLFPEEFDPRQPDRCLKFSNPATCQNFVSAWYQRESRDPRAVG